MISSPLSFLEKVQPVCMAWWRLDRLRLDRWLWPDVRLPAAPQRLRAMSIPIDSEHAVGGDLVAGDRIDLISVVEAKPTMRAYRCRGAVGPLRKSRITHRHRGYYLVVAVDDKQALPSQPPSDTPRSKSCDQPVPPWPSRHHDGGRMPSPLRHGSGPTAFIAF